jgi:hypothetical protein
LIAVLVGVVLLFVLIGTVPDLWNYAHHITPGMVEFADDRSVEGYRLNADSTVTFRGYWSGCWTTRPVRDARLVPMRAWWWERLSPPRPERTAP